jgi:diguanylate cyclase (GGDEF)-like protein
LFDYAGDAKSAPPVQTVGRSGRYETCLQFDVPNRERRTTHHALTYPVLGVLLSLGAPLGLAATRFLARNEQSIRSIFEDVARDQATFVYLTVSTMVVFVLLGAILGRQTDRLEERSTTDSLTHLANRRHFDTELGLELRRAARYGTPLSLLLVDVDHLKRINDESGHEAGDAALRAVASALLASLRATDLAARWGGDEFVVLAPGIDAAGARALADRIRGVLRGTARVSPTVSIGIADTGGAPTVTAGDLAAAADRALYDAKHAGRDRASVRSTSLSASH